MRKWTDGYLANWHRDRAAYNLRMARFMRSNPEEVAALILERPDWRIRDHYRLALAHARHARSLAAHGTPDRFGCSL